MRLTNKIDTVLHEVIDKIKKHYNVNFKEDYIDCNIIVLNHGMLSIMIKIEEVIKYLDTSVQRCVEVLLVRNGKPLINAMYDGNINLIMSRLISLPSIVIQTLKDDYNENDGKSETYVTKREATTAGR